MTNEEIEKIASQQLDASGCGKKQYNVKIDPARPSVYDVAMDPVELEKMKPIPGAAFPT